VEYLFLEGVGLIFQTLLRFLLFFVKKLKNFGKNLLIKDLEKLLNF